MDAERIGQLAGSALSGFEDLKIEDAVESAVWDLCEILKDVADDPASIALVARIEARVGGEGFIGNRKLADVA